MTGFGKLQIHGMFITSSVSSRGTICRIVPICRHVCVHILTGLTYGHQILYITGCRSLCVNVQAFCLKCHVVFLLVTGIELVGSAL